ncbi:MAG: hypothetical protein RLZZ247_1113, partial [Cyanobacteriota bacterium]
MSAVPTGDVLTPIEAWFTQQGWTPMAFQRQCWQAYLAGESGLLQVPTGSGKTYAAVMGPIAEMLAAEAGTDRQKTATAQYSVQTAQNSGHALELPHQKPESLPKPQRKASRTTAPSRGLRLLVITPLRALSRDLALAIE